MLTVIQNKDHVPAWISEDGRIAFYRTGKECKWAAAICWKHNARPFDRHTLYEWEITDFGGHPKTTFPTLEGIREAVYAIFNASDHPLSPHIRHYPVRYQVQGIPFTVAKTYYDDSSGWAVSIDEEAKLSSQLIKAWNQEIDGGRLSLYHRTFPTRTAALQTLENWWEQEATPYLNQSYISRIGFYLHRTYNKFSSIAERR